MIEYMYIYTHILYGSEGKSCNREFILYYLRSTIIYRNELGIIVFKTNIQFTMNIVFNECSAVHLHFNALQVT